MLAYLFGISHPTPIKYAWVGICLINVCLMLAILWRTWNPFFRLYLIGMASATLTQGSPLWNEWSEIALALLGAMWMFTLLPLDRHGRLFSVCIGVLVAMAMMFALPPPWPHYHAGMYFTRLYSSAAFLGIAFASCLLPWSVNHPVNWQTMVAVPWFMAVILAGSQRGWDRWVVGIVTNSAWALCLILWLTLSAAPGPRSVAHKTANAIPRKSHLE